jgi:hypothetical protein
MSATTLGFGFQGGGSGGGGAPGQPGLPGSVWRNGDGLPSNSLGINGDYYLDNLDGFVYKKIGGTYQFQALIKGADGTNGTNGSVWYTGIGVPSPSPSYNANDFFLDNDTGDVYQYDGSVWNLQTNIFGTDGTNGSVWYTDAGFPPPVGTYNASDLYLDTDTNEVYQYDGTNWNQVTNIQGVNGSQWYTGSGDPTTITNDGDFYLNAVNGDVWEIVTGTWQNTGTNIKGATGSNGTDGSVWYSGVVYPPVGTFLPTDFFLDTTNGYVYQYDGSTWIYQLTIVGTGIAGSVWFNGNGAPSTLEADGDYYLDNLTGDVYQQVSGSWGSPIANIKGANGTQGVNGTNGANSVNWLFESSVSPAPSNLSFVISNPNTVASAQTYFNFSYNNAQGVDQTTWLNAAKTLSDSFNGGYLQVTTANNPSDYAVYQITSINSVVGINNYYEFNVTYFGGNDYNFSSLPINDSVVFSYSFDGATGSVWFNGNGAPSTLEADGDYYLDNLTGDVYQQVSGSWGTPIANIKGAQGNKGDDGVSSSYFFYRTDTTNIGGAPSNQRVNWNNSTQVNSTEIGIDVITDDNVDITIFLALINIGDTIIIQDQNDSANYQTWLVNAPVQNNTTWFNIFVTLITFGGNGLTGNFADNHPIILAISREGAAGMDGANSQRYNYDPNTGGTPLAYSFTADGGNYNLSTTFKFDYFSQSQTDVTAWWNALITNFGISPLNNFLQIRNISNQAEMGSYLITQVLPLGTYVEITTNSALAQLGSFGTEVSVSYTLGGATGGRGANAPNSVNWVYVTLSPPTSQQFTLSNPSGNASTQTFFELNNFSQGSFDQSDWFNGAKLLSDAGNTGYLQVSVQDFPSSYAIYEITSISDDTTFFTFNVSFFAGIDFAFNYPLFTQFVFSYVFNGTGGGSPLTIQDEGGAGFPNTTNINFTGAGVTATQTSAGNVEVAISGSATPLTIQDEGGAGFPNTTNINFTGAGVTATQTSAGNVQVAVSGGSGGFGGIVSSIRSLSTSTTLSPFVVGTLTMPYDGIITGWTIFSDVAGGCDVRYYVGTFASYPPTTPLFTGLNPNPTLTAEISNDASGLSVAVTKGQVIQCELFAVSGAMTRIDVTLQITKS